MGAESDLLALYMAQTYLGSILTSLSLVLMRGRRTKTFAVWCWMAARSLFLVFAFVSEVYWVMVVMAFFWLLEAFPNPAYTRIIQAIYPAGVRGKALSLVRLGMTGAILLTTPFAGWMLDHWGFRVIFPVAALLGMLSTWQFNRLDVEEGTLPPRETRSVTSLVGLVRSNRNFAIHLLSFTFFGLGGLIGVAFYPIVQVDRLGLSYTTIGLLGMAQSVTWLLGFVYWGRAVDRLGGVWVMRVNLAIGVLVPFSYIWAENAWMLLPAFIAQGIISAGIDLGLINTTIQLAEPEKLVEYAAVQATVIGIRGMIGPFIGVALVNLGVEQSVIFALGAGLTAVAWWVSGYIQLPLSPEEMRAKRERLRFRWPLRFRHPRV
nr:major facilitator superfamily MFS_1 protein [uncultured bacterium]